MRLRVAAGVALVVLAAVVVIAVVPRGAPRLGPTVRWGITVDPALDAAPQIAADRALVGRRPAVVTAFIATSLQAATQTRILDDLRSVNRSHEVMVTWEPSDGLEDIASGAADPTIDRFLAQLATFPERVDLRFAHEMNGNWYAWSGDPALYVRAWNRVRDRVDAVAPRVRMVWSVNNVDRPVGNALERYWPGRDRVDVIGIDGYNCLRGWESPSRVFDEVYARVADLDPSAPIWITETASCEAGPAVAGSAGHSKAEWITELLSSTDLPRVSTVVWFDRAKEFDWRVDSSAASAEALRSGLDR